MSRPRWRVRDDVDTINTAGETVRANLGEPYTVKMPDSDYKLYRLCGAGAMIVSLLIAVALIGVFL